MATHTEEGQRVVLDPELLAEAHEGLITDWDEVPDSVKEKIRARQAREAQS